MGSHDASTQWIQNDAWNDGLDAINVAVKNSSGTILNPATSDNQTNGSQKTLLIDPTTGGSAELDNSTNTLQTIDYEHHEIHAGSHYYVCGYGTYAADGQVEFQLTTPATPKEIHMVFDIVSTGAVVFSVYEGATVAAGTAITALNNNRNSENPTSLTLLQRDGAVSVAGTLIEQSAFGVSGNPNQRKGGNTDRNKELILKYSTTYRFLIESNTADNIISYCGEWYEHTPKN